MLEMIRLDDIKVETDTDEFESYDVKILAKPSTFELNDVECKSKYSALVTLKGKGFQKTIEYAAISKRAIYRLIERNQPIRLSNVYIKGFSISEYKEQRRLDKYEDLSLKAFDAVQSFFDKHFDLSMTKILSKSSKYNDTIFAGGFIDFRMTSFRGIDTQFLKCVFFDSTVEFSEAEFTGEAFFTWTSFLKSRFFFRSAKIVKCDFVFSDIYVRESDLLFEGASFENADITFSVCQKGLSKCNLIFSGIACEGGRYDFSGNYVTGDIVFMGCYLDNALVLRGIKCENLIIRDCTITDMLDINNRKDVTVHFSTISLLNTIISGSIYLDWESLNIERAINNQKGTTEFDKASQFVKLKENYSSLGLYEYEDEAYVAFKRAQRKGRFRQSIAIKQMKDWWKLLVIPFYAFFHFIIRVFSVDIISKYATSPLRVVISMVGTIIAFSVPYAYLIDFSTVPLHNMVAPIYYSAVNFLTIGDAGIQVLNPAVMIMCTIEGFIGLLLITYFTTALVRKILR